MHTIRVKYAFRAMHALKGGGVDEEAHLHEFRCEVELGSRGLDEAGCVVDFHELDRRMGDVLGELSGKNLCEHPLFEGRSPSAEVIAEVLHGEIKRALEDKAVSVSSVTVWEDEYHAGCFREDR